MKEHDDNIERMISYDGFTNTGLAYEIELDKPELLAQEEETTRFLVDRRKGIDAAIEYLEDKTWENMIDLRYATTISILDSALAGITAIPAIADLVKGDCFSFAGWSLIPIIAGYFGVKTALIATKVIKRSEDIYLG